MKTSQRGINLIKSFEGFRSKAYKCPAGVWTIGYGSTSNVREGMVISEQQAETMLRNDLMTAENAVNNQRLDINQNKFDALVSFVFNCGSGNFAKSTLLKRIKINPHDPSIYKWFAVWNKGGGKVLPGLVRRRKEEAELYFT